MARDTLYDRIEQRLSQLGIKAEAASLMAGMGRDGIRNIKRGKSTSPRGRNVKALAEVLQCSVEYLLGDDAALPPPPAVLAAAPPGYVAVPAIAGGGAEDGWAAAPQIPGTLKYFEEELVRYGLRAQPSDLLTMEVEGQSMEPLLQNGDRVLIDTKKISLAEPGLFVLWDGGGVVCKWVQRVLGSNPTRLRLISENTRFEAYDVRLDEARIIGRVVWFARRI